MNGGGRGRASIVWGGAADNRLAYYGIGGAGLAAVQQATGEVAWLFAPPQPEAAAGGRGRGPSLGAATTAIPGVVFQGSSDGTLYAIGAADGKKLWEYPTAKEFETINRVIPAHGGAISTSGAVVVDGMVYVGSGYAVGSGAQGGNVLLALGSTSEERETTFNVSCSLLRRRGASSLRPSCRGRARPR